MPIALPKSHPKVKDDKDHYPIKDADQARNALARVAQAEASPPWFDGTLKELQSIVRKAVAKEYPSIEVTMSEFTKFADVQTWNDLRNKIETAVRGKYAPLGGEDSRDATGGVFLADILVSERAVIIQKPDGEFVKLLYDLGGDDNILIADEELPVKQEWVEAYADEIRTVTIPDVEIFMGGARETPEYDEDAIDAMVNAGNELAGEIKPPIFAGHTRAHGWPAFGYLANFKKAGMKVIADLIDVPEKMAAWIKSKGYSRVSPEILPEYTSENNKKFKNIIYGLALLGQDIPRLKLLKDLPIPVYESDPETQVYRFEVNEDKTINGGESKMPEKNEAKTVVEVEVQRYSELIDIEKRLAEMGPQLAKVEEYAEVIKTRDARIGALEGEVKTFSEEIAGMKKAATEAKIAGAIESLTKEGKTIPAEHAEIKEFAESLDDKEVKEYSEDFSGTQLDKYIRQLSARKPAVNFSEESHGDIVPVETKEDDSDLKARVEKYAEENKCSFAEAISKVVTKEDEQALQGRIR